ncbi:MAG: TMEM175 family protein [Pseudomonadota bacterium]|nr:TMEM175 family protein [Pseudomonadota bacterium]
MSDDEGRHGVGRVGAFSDGVLAIIITIMVLELKAPEQPGLQYLLRLWPTFAAYALSFAYVGIYWVNHHRLFGHATRVSNALVWFNLGLLFALSLIPFSTAYLGNMHFSRDATWLYLATMLLPAFSYVPLQHVIRATGSQSDPAQLYHRQTTRKGLAAAAVYIAGIPLTLVSPWLGIGCALIVAVLWFLPNSPFDRWFER